MNYLSGMARLFVRLEILNVLSVRSKITASIAEISNSFYFLVVVTKPKALYRGLPPQSGNYYSNMIVLKKEVTPLNNPGGHLNGARR